VEFPFNPIPYSKHHFTEADIAAAVQVLREGAISQGPLIQQFEAAFAAHTGARHALAVNSGTAALHMAVLGMGVKPGQLVITSPLTFAATAAAAIHAGAALRYVDIDPASLCIDFEQTEALLYSLPRGTCAGIIAVSFAGYPIDLPKWQALAKQYSCWLIEDASHSVGAAGAGYTSGDGTADISTFSFHPVKHIATGEGGMLTTNHTAIYERLKTLRSHGIRRDAGPPAPAFYHEVHEAGYNYRISDILAALGLSQLARVSADNQRRRQLAAKYDAAFAGTTIQTPSIEAGITHAYHLYIIQVTRRNELYEYLKTKNIFTQVHYIPLHLHPAYASGAAGPLPHTDSYYSRCLSLPLYPTLSDDEQAYVIHQVLAFYK